jgi:large subunit ribosomal protein L23
MSPKSIALIPKISEKTYALSDRQNTYTFIVPKNVNKHTLALAVKEQFNVTVKTVRLVNQNGKAKRTLRNGGRTSVKGQRSDYKKAYVVLAAGDKLPIFVTENEKSSPDQKKEKK